MKSQRSASLSRSVRSVNAPPRHRMRVQSAHGFGEFTRRRGDSTKRNCTGSCSRNEARRESLRRAADRLHEHLENCLAASDTIPTSDLAAFVSALALTELALAPAHQSFEASPECPVVDPLPQNLPVAESVVDYSANEMDSLIQDSDTEGFLWRRELENLWRRHITKDEFHRPVVRSIGLPVLVIVDHVRSGRSWKSICENYPGLVWDDIRAAVSMATECGWLDGD